MPENIVDTAVTPEVAPEVKPEVAAEKPVEKTVAQLVAEAEPVVDPKKPETVGLDKFLELKNDLKIEKAEKKALADRLTALEKNVNKGASEDEISADIAAIGDEFNVDKKFLSKLAKVIETQADAKAEEKLKPFQKASREQAIDNAFQTHYAATLETMPEYKDIANPDVIKALTLLPTNKDKTFPQILEETYGKSLPGKRTIETTRPGGGKEPQALDIDKARRDTKYFQEVMANPKLKAEYNKAMLDRRM